ncbi:MAG: CARDB domain-containing protein [Candidatus Poseidoniaceae archaeon]|nr:CARDB domain-containing protein [Candidatus Poseidoniaceae archaeon]
MGGRVVAVSLVTFLLLSMLSVSPPVATHLDMEEKSFNTSAVNIVFSNGPAEDESVTGLKTIAFSLTGTGTIDSILVEIAEVGGSYSTLTNLTGTPWLFNFDSTSQTNGTYTLRATGWDSAVSDVAITTTDEFTIDNQVPVITAFTALSPDVGAGTTSSDRAWFNVSQTGTIEFRYGISDDDFDRATLQNVPGPGTPATDGPTSLAYGWDWSTGSFSEGTWNPRLTVFDNSGLSSSETIFIGIDRSGPAMNSVLIGNGNAWQSSSSVNINGILDAANDGTGSGVDFVELQVDSGSWTSLSSNSHTLELSEGNHSISLRATDRVGNIGNTISETIRIDTSMPELVGWTVDPLTTDLIGTANISYSTYDLLSGIDISAVSLQYGFDSNGVGLTPDLSGQWLELPGSGLDRGLAMANWATKSRQYLMLRATIADDAGNSETTEPQAFQVMPGLDLSWNATTTDVDRLVVRPGETFGNVTITGELRSNQIYAGAVVVSLEAAPADRSATTQWTVMNVQTLPAGSLGDGVETIEWSYTVPNSGQYDLRVRIDPTNVIDENSEINNDHYMVVTGADVSSPGLVPSFAPTLTALICVGFIVAWLQQRD